MFTTKMAACECLFMAISNPSEQLKFRNAIERVGLGNMRKKCVTEEQSIKRTTCKVYIIRTVISQCLEVRV